MTTRYIFITGGVLSSLGKGLAAASLAALLQAQGYKVRLRKLDPYLNVDPGTLSPFQHGEVFVTDDGTETDLDLGHYERYTGVPTTKDDTTTAGKIYSQVIAKERRGDYLGSTVQVIPHVTDAIKQFITYGVTDEDFVLCEIGGTVGDIEGLPFVEAIRQLGNDLGRDRVLYIHLTLVPYIASAQELKTKPTQHSVKELSSLGIQPDMILCRCDRLLSADTKAKIATFCNIRPDHVFEAIDVANIYEVPIWFHETGLDARVCDYFKLPFHGAFGDAKAMVRGVPSVQDWRTIVQRYFQPEHTIKIAVVGKYVGYMDCYKSLAQSLTHAGIAANTRLEIQWLNSETDDLSVLKDIDGILVPGGFGLRGTEGKLAAIRYAREQKVPFLGICFGMQLAVIEFARHVAGISDANSTEFGPTTAPVVCLLTEWLQNDVRQQRQEGGDLGGTLRVGAYPCAIAPGSKAEAAYGALEIRERHRHRYEVNPDYRQDLEKHGLWFSGTSPDGQLPEIIELRDHPWFVAVQYHPEFKSRPFAAHPLFVAFVQAALARKK